MTWAPTLGLELSLRSGGAVWPLLALVVGTAAVVGWWSVATDEPTGRRTRTLLGVFVLAMSALLSAGDVVTYVVAWEVTSVISYLLVGTRHGTTEARSAARTTLVVTGLGGVALLVGLLLVAGAAGSTAFADLLAASPDDPRVVVGLGLVVLGAATKSAQVPVHGWLPGAGTAPSSASALLHAATLVIAGVHAVLLVAPLGQQVPGWSTAVAAIGLTTFVWCGWAALRADAAKRMLAGTTSAQLGLAFAVAGLGTDVTATATVALLVAHGTYKAALFLVVGTVKVTGGAGTVDELAALAATSRPARLVVWCGALALAGAPPLAGWVTKETAVATLMDAHGAWVVPLLVAGAALGVLVAARIVGLDRLVAVRRIGGPARVMARTHLAGPARRPGAALAAPAVLLLVTLALGVDTGALTAWVRPAAAGGEIAKLVLWPGLVPALGVSVAGLALGVALVAVLPMRRRTTPWDAPALLARGIDAALRGASAATDRVHAMARPAVVAVVAGTSLAALTPAVAAASRVPDTLPVVGSWSEAAVAVVIVLAVGGILRTRHRMGGAVLLGVVGYGLAGLFAVRGAPDLVLTQVVVETIVVVVFVAVLTRMAPTAPRSTAGTALAGSRPRQLATSVRASVALLGAVVTADLAATLTARAGQRGLAAMADAEAVPVGAGTNVVNVILTDFRALDTMGELLVLALGALAVLALGRATPGPTAGTVRPPSQLLARTAPLLTRIAIVMGIHLLAVGHDQPGGGFVGGLVIGAGVALHRLATGVTPGRPSATRPARLLGAGTAVVAAVMVAPLLVGRPLGDMGSLTLDLGLLGATKLTSALALDLGVVLVVLGLTLAALDLLGTDDRDVDGPRVTAGHADADAGDTDTDDAHAPGPRSDLHLATTSRSAR